MEKRNFRKSMLAILLGVLLYHTAVLAEVDKLNISQILQKGNDVYLYVNSLDAAERPAEDVLLAEQLSVNIDGGEAVPVQEAAIFQSLGQGISYTFCIDVSKSVTEQEMAEIREGITGLINGMSEKDFARIITVGGEVTPLCDYTQDKEALTGAVQNVQRTADFTYLYKGISFALDGYRKSVETMPERGALILFTDGMDDSDGASSEEQVLLDLAETRIPVYVVGLKGNDASANLNSVGQIARQSGGSVYSYSDMAIGEAVQAIGEVMRNTYQLHVRPGDDAFGKQNLVWNATYHPESYSVTSKNYVYSLGMENVVLTTPEPIPEPASEPASEPAPAPETEEESVAEPTPAPETEEESAAEPTSAPETEEEPAAEPTSAPETEEESAAESTPAPETEEESAAESTPAPETEEESAAESTPAPETEEEPAAEPTSAPETEEESEEGLIDRVMDFVKENIIICVATGFVLVALIIILVMVVRKKKGAGSSDIVEPLGNGDPLTENGIDKTLGDPTYSDEATIGAYDNDDEETVDGSQERGLRLQFEITFGGRKETVERILGEELVLGRGNECDVDVVLSSTAEERKQTSRKHAVILNRPDGLYIKDTSRNKTYLNGVEVAEESALRDEDILQLGKASVKVRILGE